MADFIYEKPFQIEKDPTKYQLLTKDYVKVIDAGERKILKVDPRGLELLAKTAVSDLHFFSGHPTSKNLLQFSTTRKQRTMTGLWPT